MFGMLCMPGNGFIFIDGLILDIIFGFIGELNIIY